MIVPFVGSSYQMDALSFGIQRTINMYPLLGEVPNTKSVAALRKCAGLSLFATVGGGAIRNGISSVSGRSFLVSGFGFYELKEDGTSVLHGSLNTATGRVAFSENTTQVICVDGTDGFIFNKDTDTFTQITSVNFPATDTVSFQDGYFLATEKTTQKFYISNLNDGLTWDAFDFTSVESNPDDLVGVLSDNGVVWLFGDRSTEVYQNTGNADFPFERIGGAIIQTGCAAPHTIQRFDNKVMWLGIDEQGRGVVWQSEGYEARRVSTQAIERIIDTSIDFTESYSWVYHEQGHIFYCMQVKGLDTTLVYDGATRMWHERAFNNPVTNNTEQHRGSCHFLLGQKSMVGDRQTGQVYEMDLSLYDDNGDEMVCERITPHYSDETRLFSYNSFELSCETGVGLVSGQGSDPKVMMTYSDDGGRTWSNELFQEIGKIGDYYQRAVWRRLGRARRRVFKVAYSDPTFFQINEAYVNAT